MKPKAIFCWSGGKDSAMALNNILQENEVEVVVLLTTLNATHKRVSMHGVREELLDLQAGSIGLPLEKMYVSEGTNAEYEKNMEHFLLKYKALGVTQVIFGDIFLEDLRAYRENNLAKVGLEAIFPLWKRDTKELISAFFSNGFKSIICCVNDAYLNEHHVGADLDKLFVGSLPANVDPCGENGEYHSYCYAGPIFKKEIKIKTGEKVYKPLEIKTDCNTEAPVTKGFWFCDILPC